MARTPSKNRTEPKDSRRGVALTEETVGRIKKVIAAAVLREDEVYPSTLSAFMSEAAEEKLDRDEARFLKKK